MIEFRLSSSSIVIRSSASPSPSFGRRQLIRSCRKRASGSRSDAIEAPAEERLEPALDMQPDLEPAVQRAAGPGSRTPSVGVGPADTRIGRVDGAPAM